MSRQLSDAEEEDLQACLDESGCKNISAMLEFIRDNQTDSLEVDFIDPKLTDLPKPRGKMAPIFVSIVNQFIRYAHEHKTYPDLPGALGETKIAMELGIALGVTTKTARMKVRQLIGSGWLCGKYRNIENPVITYNRAAENYTPHPAFNKNRGT